MQRFARLGLIAAILALLLLDFAALDDITTGNEPDVSLEYAMLAVSVPLFAACVWGLSRLKARQRRDQWS